jgi:hypothetical protein
MKVQVMDSVRLHDKCGINLAYTEHSNGGIIPLAKVVLEHGF